MSVRKRAHNRPVTAHSPVSASRVPQKRRLPQLYAIRPKTLLTYNNRNTIIVEEGIKHGF